MIIMDSGNNSAQSSSGADEECDSRAALQDSGQITTLHLPHQPPPPSFNHHLNQTNNLNNINPLFFSSSLDSVVWSNTLPSFSDHHLSTTTVTTTSTNPIPPARNPKKRSRASRRAPTTVLTTDTNNFRTMVQQYTGIPSLSPETSLDLFGTRSNLQNLRSNFPYYSSSPSFINDSCINLLNTMQNPISFPYNNINSLNHSPLLNLKATENPNSSNGFGGINGQTAHIHQQHSTTLPDLLSTAVTPTTTSSRNDDHPVASGGNWESISGMKGDQGFIEPWTN